MVNNQKIEILTYLLKEHNSIYFSLDEVSEKFIWISSHYYVNKVLMRLKKEKIIFDVPQKRWIYKIKKRDPNYKDFCHLWFLLWNRKAIIWFETSSVYFSYYENVIPEIKLATTSTQYRDYYIDWYRFNFFYIKDSLFNTKYCYNEKWVWFIFQPEKWFLDEIYIYSKKWWNLNHFDTKKYYLHKMKRVIIESLLENLDYPKPVSSFIKWIISEFDQTWIWEEKNNSFWWINFQDFAEDEEFINWLIL